MKAQLLSVSGNKLKEISLPKVFGTGFEPEMIKRAVLSIQSARFQPKSTNILAGRDTSADYIGARGKPQHHRTINVGRARLPRKKDHRSILYGDVAGVSQAVGGPKAHPPKTAKKLLEKINKKEKRKALDSAIAATAVSKLVSGRGHKLSEKVELPLVVENKFEEFAKTKQVRESLKALNVWVDVERAVERKHIRAGKGKKRGRKYKRKKSVLIVTGEKAGVFKSARNLEGVEVIQARNLNAELLAPGARAGRLTVWTENALNELKERESK